MVTQGAPDTAYDLEGLTLRFFVALRLLRTAWAGALLMGIGLHGAGRALALASRAAGAASLFLEDDTTLLRQTQREGCSTFTVTVLEEAIRILKNEVRQGRAVTVALRQAPAEALEEALRRGLQPQVLAFSRPPSGAEMTCATALGQRGASTLAGFSLVDMEGAMDLEHPLHKALAAGWRLRTDVAETLQERRSRDAELLVAAQSHDAPEEAFSALSVEWLRVAPLLLPRSLCRSFLVPGALA